MRMVLAVHFFKEAFRQWHNISFTSILKMICLAEVLLLTGCDKNHEMLKETQGETRLPWEEMSIRVTSEGYIDSAQVLFFKNIQNRDTLVYREVIYNIGYGGPHAFQFELPAGKYTVCIFGNVPSAHIVLSSPYTSGDILLDYSTGRQTSGISYGKSYLNVGADTATLSGMVYLSSSVHLTIANIPIGIDHIITRLLNTSAGFILGQGFIQKSVDPPLADTLFNIRGNTDYFVPFFCFPGIGSNDSSMLEVKCYNGEGQVLYSGSSASFLARPGENYNISCSFENLVLESKSSLSKTGKLVFKRESE